MKTMRKVWRYIAKYKKLLFISLTAMIIVQSLGLVAPLIVKSILDDYLVGIERPWYEVSQTDKQITYQGRYFSQETTSSEIISIVIYKGKYYFVEEDVVDGNKSLEGNILTIIEQDGTQNIYDAKRLDKQEVIQFYKPFVNPLIFLIVLLTIRFFLQTIFTYIQRITTSMINVNIVRDARKDAVKALQKMPMTYFETEPAGKIANRIISDVAGMMNLFSTIMNLLINASLAVIFAYIGMFLFGC